MEPDGSVRHQVVLDLPQEQAFWAFPDLDRIKPREHNMLAVPIDRTVLEQHVGGDVYDRGVDGSLCRWGRVLAFDPPNTIAFSWDIGPDWQVATDLERTAKWRSTSPLKGMVASRWSTGTLTGTAPAGRACATASTSKTVGRCTWPDARP